MHVSIADVGGASLKAVDGHVLYAFVAKENPSDIFTTFEKEDDVPMQVMVWYGCQVLPAF